MTNSILSLSPFSFSVAFGLDFYTEILDLNFLLDHLSDHPFFQKYKKLNKVLVGLVEDYSLVSFVPLNIPVKMPSYYKSLVPRLIPSISTNIIVDA